VDKNKTHLKKLIPKFILVIKEFVKNNQFPEIRIKEDGTPVTTLDLILSQYFESQAGEFPNSVFYSEENFSEWGFPLIALDPLDGTQEYINENPEWAVSLAVLENDHFHGCGWVFNPMTEESYFSPIKRHYQKKSSYRGEVSKSEWKKGLFKNKSSDEFQLKAVGSIAYKLARLSNGQCDFVVSLQPKNIWDIAAGTVLCHEAGMKFYSQGKEVTKVEKRYEIPLIWCHEELWPSLQKLFP